jgi:hypothetical protein
MASDDSLSAGQLRKRYTAMPDDQMSASQLRSRKAIPGNKFQDRSSGSNSNLFLVGGLVAVVMLAIVSFVLME